MWLSKKKYRALICELDGIKAKQRELEQKTEQRLQVSSILHSVVCCSTPSNLLNYLK